MGQPPPPPWDAWTSDEGTTHEGAPTTTTGIADTTTLGEPEPTTSTGASTSGGPGCELDIECQPGQQCMANECVACEPPSCPGCPDPMACQCPPGDPCCELGTCTATLCDPLVQDCPEGEGCYALEDGFSCEVDASGRLGVATDPCEYINACDPGFICLSVDAVPGCMGAFGCCSAFCDLTSPAGDAQCLAGQTCTPWYEPDVAPPGYEDVGVCVLPA